MDTCRFVKSDGDQCKRKVLTGKLCWQHSSAKKVNYFLLFAATVGLLVNFDNIRKRFNGDIIQPDLQVSEIECNRDRDLGCKVDFSHGKFNYPIRYIDKNKFSISIIPFLEGGNVKVRGLKILPNDSIVMDPVLLGPRFPEFTNGKHHISGPFQVRRINNEIHFHGKVKDLHTDELLGWFDGDEFGVIKPCSFSWNKDIDGIEIIDKYGYVSFSIDVEKVKYKGTLVNAFSYKGYYKVKDYYYIFNDKEYRTKDLKEAIELIKKIEPVFDHYGTNSMGKRKVN